MTEDPQQPERGAPEEGAPGAGGPEQDAPEGGVPEEGAPEAGGSQEGPSEGVPGEPGEATPSESDAPGPEIQGVEELAGAAREPEGEGPAGEEAGGEEAAAEEAAPGEAAREEAAPEGAQPEAGAPEEGPPEEPAAPPRAERPRPGRRRKRGDEQEEEVIPGAHLEPDLVLEEQRAPEEAEYAEYAEYAEAEAPPAEEGEPLEEAPPEPQPVARRPLDLAADARYRATGKRKSAVARVILKPGEGTITINHRHLDEYFPRVRLQRLARQPLEATGNHGRMDVVARIHGGGVSAQATALRHGVARALVEADPALRGELKRRGYLTRDPRVKERKKAGLKKARKRPQFSKR
jgi:small subunit ribosomal protein S9